MKNKTVIIVGAGPGGLATAKKLKEISDYDVIVLEENPEISYKICAGGIDPDLSKFGISEDIIERRFIRVKISTPWQSVWLSSSSEAEKPIVATLNRKTLHEYMAKKALESGVKILFNKRVASIDRKNNAVITSDGEVFYFDYLIGADGSNSVVRKSLELEKKRYILAIQYMIHGYYPDIEFHLDIEKFDMSYAWIFPQDGAISVGAGYYPGVAKISMQHLRKNLDEWIKTKFGPESLKGARFEAFPILFDYQGHEFGNIFLIGDAAGLAHDLTGGGIASTIVSGEDIAKEIVDPEYNCPGTKKILEKKKSSRAFFELMASSGTAKRKIIIETFVFLLKMPFLGKKIASRIL